MMLTTYSEKYFLSAGECNAEREMALPLLVAKFIDIATAHANAVHLGNPDMEQHHAGWVLSRMTIEMERFPTVDDSYSITTWVERWTRRFSVRCFRVDSSDGSVLGYARSIWMILSTDSHESLPLTILPISDKIEADEECPIEKSEKHRTILPFGIKPDSTDSLEATSEPVSHTFRYSDLDFYRHVNTVRYFTLLLNQFTLEEMDTTYPFRVEISFMREGKYDETIEVRRHDRNLESAFSLIDPQGQSILFARIVRRARQHKS